MAASETTLIEKFEIISTEGQAVEISGGISAFFYYEDIFSPCVTDFMFSWTWQDYY